MSVSINLHGVKHIGVNTHRICPEDGESYTNTSFFFLDKDGSHVDICLLNCAADVEFIGERSAFDFSQEKQREEREAEIFRNLTPQEEETFIKWARANYKPGEPIDWYWHPIARREADCMNREIQNELREEV